jgi:hypothetical protein
MQTNMRKWSTVLMVAVIAVWIGGGVKAAFAASHTFTAIDVPGSLDTQVYGINDEGQIVGSYRDAQRGMAFCSRRGSSPPLMVRSVRRPSRPRGLISRATSLACITRGPYMAFCWPTGSSPPLPCRAVRILSPMVLMSMRTSSGSSTTVVTNAEGWYLGSRLTEGGRNHAPEG